MEIPTWIEIGAAAGLFWTAIIVVEGMKHAWWKHIMRGK